MSGACCVVDVDEPADVYRRQDRRAAKEHSCDECGRKIFRGERYEYVAMCYDGGWSNWRTCRFCAALVRDYCGGVQLHGGLAEILGECLGYDLINDQWYGEDKEDEDE